MSPTIIMAAVAALMALLLLGGLLLARGRFIKTVPPGSAVVVTRPGSPPIVTFTSVVFIPGIHHATLVDMTVKLLKVERGKANPLLSRDEQRFRGVFTFYLQVSKTEDGVLHATQKFGEKPLDLPLLRECFLPKFDEALDTVAAMMTAEQLVQGRQTFKDEVLNIIGTDLNGFSLDDMAIDELVRLER